MSDITPYTNIYNRFESKVTDDMYMEMTKEETAEQMEALLESATSFFEFPRKDLTDRGNGQFNCSLDAEEEDILAVYMMVEWFTQQIATVENTRLKYSGTDFKFTSQANHSAKLLNLKKEYEREGFHLQRLYKRRKKGKKGIYHSTMREIILPLEKEED